MRSRYWFRRLLVVGGSVLVLIIGAQFAMSVLFAAALGPGPMARCDGREQFQPQLWQDSAAVHGPLRVRGCMVDDLRRSHRLRGLSRAEVVALLGEPPPTNYFREYDLVYWLGPERSPLGIDSEWLVIRVDETGLVVEDRLITD